MAVEIEQHTNDLVANICSHVNGVGPTTANAVAADFSANLVEFLQAGKQRFEAIKNSKGKRFLSDKQITQLIAIKAPYSKCTDTRETWIFYIGRQFLSNVVEHLEELHLRNIDINPFLAIALELKTPEQVLKFNLYQTVTRSVVTTWGTVVEQLLARCGADRFLDKNVGRSGRRPDVTKIVQDTEYFIQVKSGPNTMNVDMVQSLNEVIAEFGKLKPKAKVLLGMTYGTREMVSSQIRTNLSNFDNASLIGRQLWDFISEQKDYHKKIFSILDGASAGILPMPFTDLMGKKLQELVHEWEAKYKSKSLHEALDDYM